MLTKHQTQNDLQDESRAMKDQIVSVEVQIQTEIWQNGGNDGRVDRSNGVGFNNGRGSAKNQIPSHQKPNNEPAKQKARESHQFLDPSPTPTDPEEHQPSSIIQETSTNPVNGIMGANTLSTQTVIPQPEIIPDSNQPIIEHILPHQEMRMSSTTEQLAVAIATPIILIIAILLLLYKKTANVGESH